MLGFARLSVLARTLEQTAPMIRPDDHRARRDALDAALAQTREEVTPLIAARAAA